MTHARTLGCNGGMTLRGLVLAIAVLGATLPAHAEDTGGFLKGIKHFSILAQTVPANGDQNPYAVLVAPFGMGKLQKDDVLITNFNDRQNLQGLGTTIVTYTPGTKKLAVYASIPRMLPQCPGGVGLTAALAMLKSGWVIVGSLPSQDGNTATKGTGCLVVLDPQGNVNGTLTGPDIDGPWGDMAVIDNGATATLFVSNTGFGVQAPGQEVVRKATVLRIELSIPPGQPPSVVRETVIASGFGQLADKDVFVVGPTGLALGQGGALYVSDAIDNRIAVIPDAATRTTSAGIGQDVTKDGFLHRPLAMITAPNGNLIVTNAQNGQCVEIDPATGKQLSALWLDTSRAQSPPGNGNLFGLAMTPAGDGFYYVKDEINALVVAR